MEITEHMKLELSKIGSGRDLLTGTTSKRVVISAMSGQPEAMVVIRATPPRHEPTPSMEIIDSIDIAGRATEIIHGIIEAAADPVNVDIMLKHPDGTGRYAMVRMFYQGWNGPETLITPDGTIAVNDHEWEQEDFEAYLMYEWIDVNWNKISDVNALASMPEPTNIVRGDGGDMLYQSDRGLDVVLIEYIQKMDEIEGSMLMICIDVPYY